METLELCIQTAKSSGCPRDQVKRFLESGYIPYPWQWQFHSAARQADFQGGPVDIGLGGARGPGKSHAVLSQCALDDCQRVPRLKGLFLRQTGTAAKESFDDLVEKVLLGHIPYNKSQFVLSFANGSRIILGGFKDENDIDKYVGIEYDFIIVEELNQLTEEKYNKLRGSLRTSKPNWRPRMYTSFNPGGSGHEFVKKRYIKPFRLNQETETRFVGGTYKDNPSLNPDYILYLESLTGDLGKAWREGDWDLFAGQFFTEFSKSIHVITPFIPDDDIKIVGGLDWGYSHPFSFHLASVSKIFMRDNHGDTIIFYRTKTFFEIYGVKKQPSEWSKLIKEELYKRFNMTLNGISWVMADSSIEDKGVDGSTSIKDQFKLDDDRWGRILKPADKSPGSRKAGWVNMHRWLSIAPDNVPYWQIASNCYYLVDTLPTLRHDENDTEDVESSRKGGIDDDCGDDQRYMLRNISIRDDMPTGALKAQSNYIDGDSNRSKFFGSNENADKLILDPNKFR
jgi:PBSX family phage terminase large subunit